jgi:hypothetical protein
MCISWGVVKSEPASYHNIILYGIVLVSLTSVLNRVIILLDHAAGEVFMSNTGKRFLVWAPRILGILFMLFVAAFALNIFNGPGISLQTLFPSIAQLIPVFILFLMLLAAWRWDWIGAILFVGYGALYLIDSQAEFPLSIYLVMAGVPFLIGILFLVSWIWKARKPVPNTRVSRR